MIDEDKNIVLNRIQCNHCGDIIISAHTHDWKQCKCGKVYVDGGTSYLRRGFDLDSDYKEMSLTEDSPFEVIRENLSWGTFGKSGKDPLKFVLLKELSNKHILNILNENKRPTFMREFLIQELEYRKENKIFIED